jgi:hypothetical protein
MFRHPDETHHRFTKEQRNDPVSIWLTNNHDPISCLSVCLAET